MEIRAYYRGYNPRLDEAIRSHAERIGAVELGSGYGFGQRDFEFKVSAEKWDLFRFTIESFGLEWRVLTNAQN